MTERTPKYWQLRDLHKVLNADAVKKAAARGGAPAWLKDFAGQLEDPDYCQLSPGDRGFLKDLRLLALRRGNKILNDEGYLRGQLRLTPRTQVDPRLHTLRDAGFLEAYNADTNTAAKDLIPSRTVLDEGEPDSALEVEVNRSEDSPKPLTTGQGSSRKKLRAVPTLRFLVPALAEWELSGGDEKHVRVWLEGFTDDAAEVAAHIDALKEAA